MMSRMMWTWNRGAVLFVLFMVPFYRFPPIVQQLFSIIFTLALEAFTGLGLRGELFFGVPIHCSPVTRP